MFPNMFPHKALFSTLTLAFSLPTSAQTVTNPTHQEQNDHHSATDSKPNTEQPSYSNHTKLNKITVQSNRSSGVANIRKNQDTIQQELIRDPRDLVRYTTDVGISDGGRHNRGFAIRGVEGNRVGITIDGISLPDSEDNSLYARYGNFNSARPSIDPELVRSIEIERGADSFRNGSGALGGTVSYHTLSSSDLTQPEHNSGLLLRTGYASKNREWVNTAGFGLRNDTADLVLLYSQRRGHELKSNSNGADINGDARGIPDPAKHQYHSYLAKIGLNLSENSRIGYTFHGQNGQNLVDEKSYALLDSWWRLADDQHRRLNHNVFIEHTPEFGPLTLVRLDADKQKTDVASVNYKGGRHWQTDEKELWEIANRRMKTDYTRLTLRLDGQPFQTASITHQPTLKAFASRKKFQNENFDQYINIGDVKYTIQHPVKTDSLGLSLADQITWTPRLKSRIGLRYDYTKVKPQDLNANCTSCDEKPAANTFRGLSGMFSLDYALSPTWQLGYDYTNGFRIPTASEMYFTYRHPAGNWLANPNLKAERSHNHSLSLKGNSDLGKFNMSIYHNRYRHFLVEQETASTIPDPNCTDYWASAGYCRPFFTTLFQQMQNIDKATINGINIEGEWQLASIGLPQGWVASSGLGYSKGKLSSDASLLSIQPIKILAGIGYERPDQNWGLFAKATYWGAKKAKDAQIIAYKGWNYDRSVEAYPYLNKAATVFDLYGYKKFGKNIVFRAGAYNLFNKKYHSWDALRGINRNSTTNSVDREGKGLERFVAPGRNFAFSLEAKF